MSSLSSGSISSDSDSECTEEEDYEGGDGDRAKLSDGKVQGAREKREAAAAGAAIVLPKDFDPFLKLGELEVLQTFLFKCGGAHKAASTNKSKEENEHRHSVTMVPLTEHRLAVRDMQVVGCLLMELFLPKKFLAIGPKASLKERYAH